MKASEIKTGEYVRLTLEGRVEWEGGFLYLTLPSGDRRLISRTAEGFATFEVIDSPEPDWQPGDIGKHRETGTLYAYADTVDEDPWIQITDWHADTYKWHTRSDLAGKLVRCTVTPEDEQ